MRYTVVIEKAEDSYSAYVPDLPGCVATGSTIEETENQIREAIVFHLEGLREERLEVLSNVVYGPGVKRRPSSCHRQT